MAGIGFELRKLMADQTFWGVLKAYGFAGIISSGPWVLSIMGIMLIGFLDVLNVSQAKAVAQFQISVTYLMAFSLILTGPLQLLFTRFIADRLYERKDDVVLPNLIGALTLVISLSGVIAMVVLMMGFHDTGVIYPLLMLVGLVVLCATWIVVGVMSGLKSYRRILLAFTLGYGTAISISVILRAYGVEGLLVGFVVGHGLLFFLLLATIIRAYPAERLIAFDFLRRGQVFVSLSFTGLFYNLGLWADKFVFWLNPDTSAAVIGPLRASAIYDLPIFLAHLSIIPGMAVFLLRMETDFAERHALFYRLIREGASLRRLMTAKDNLVASARQCIYDIVKIQGFTVVLLFAAGEHLLRWFGISPLYRILLNVDVLATGVQVILITILGILFYFDQRRVTLLLSIGFALCNFIFSVITQHLGPAFYGYGFAFSVFLITILGVAILSRKLDKLEYETFMLQQAAI